MKRKGLGKGLGQGYKNIAPMDSHIHRLSARGVKTTTTQQLVKPMFDMISGKFVPQGQVGLFNLKAKGKVKVPEWVTITSTAGDVFESARWQLTHTKVGEQPNKVLEATLDGFIKKGFADPKLRKEILAQAKIYMDDTIKRFGEPPKTVNAKGVKTETVHFSVTGEFLTRISKEIARDKGTKAGVKFLTDSVVGFTEKMAKDVVSGKKKLVGVNDLKLVKLNAKITRIKGTEDKEGLAREINDLLAKRGYDADVFVSGAMIDVRQVRLSDLYVKNYGRNLSPYTGNRGRILGWRNWIEVNDAINDVLDKNDISANVSSLGGKFRIRKRKRRMTEQDWEILAGENVGSVVNPISREDAWLPEFPSKVESKLNAKLTPQEQKAKDRITSKRFDKAFFTGAGLTVGGAITTLALINPVSAGLVIGIGVPATLIGTAVSTSRKTTRKDIKKELKKSESR